MATIAPFSSPLFVMLKPTGLLCNLACKYCYYVENLFDTAKAFGLIASGTQLAPHDDGVKRSELYNIETDCGETTNVADQHPEIVEHLQQLWKQWAARDDVKDFGQFRELTRKNRKAIL